MDLTHLDASYEIVTDSSPTGNGNGTKTTSGTPKSSTGTPSTTTSLGGSPNPSLPLLSQSQNLTTTRNRFQCPQCPKNFTRIENLTRHQANHDEVGKFACPVCKKRFTRSDLLSRHRRIHKQNNGPDKRGSSSRTHITQCSASPSSQPQPISNLVHGEEKSTPINHVYGSALPPSMPYRTSPSDILPPIQEALYSDSRSSSAPSQGLSSLVEAALAPPPLDDGLNVPENFNPNTWDGFMLYNDSPNVYMGSYDADISWTLDCFSQDSWSNMELDFGFSAPGVVQPDPSGQSNDLYAEGDEEDWPDKVSRLESPPRWDPKAFPRLCPGSWHSAALEARASSFTIGPRQQVNDILRSTLLGILQADLPAESGDTLRVLDNIFTLFNLLLAGAWGGSKKKFEYAEGVRGILVTAGRRARLLDCRPTSRVQLDPNSLPNNSPQEVEWFSWIETEKRKRLGLSIYILDCQYATLFNVQSCISRAETTNCVFPCPEQHWEAPSPQAWKMLLGPADIPPATYFLHALNGVLLHKWTKPPPPVIPTTIYGRTLLLYAIHTLIFDWRTSVSMLNPTGLMGTMGNYALDIGTGLWSRRKWLIDALDSWSKNYGSSSGEQSVAGKLLCALGYVNLDVSLSDVHLMAGRSSNRQDCDFAAVNLRYWANSEIVGGTMKNVYEMLALSEQCIRMRDSRGGDGVLGTMGSCSSRPEEASYEIAVCLFTGGLVCWVYKELRTGLVGREREEVVEGIRSAGRGLRGMRCWGLCETFGRILAGFEA
ncbi:hypothetical protein DSL72_000797 [Monilinia vaccinii-corymbosi]|uniref:C2H2-type domain-containing protein n=1 Tax=Monilinia vaccinii-corymbosi TaxID=61207 RepID=A0A8A3P4Y9_9HELO|nr:hypothetical protein DSL72_000797 [Monilinia vaccinii-corymbosi]